MAHMIEDNKMFSVVQEPWHKQGVVLDSPPTSEEAIKAAGMDWDVLKLQLFYTPGYGSYSMHPAENAFGLFRETDNKLFGVVSEDYTVVQNRESFAFFDPLVREGMADYETAGVLTDGRVWVLARVRGDMQIGPDEVRRYLLLANDHSGSGSVQIQPTMIRVVCNNTLRASLSSGFVFRQAHRQGVHDRMNDVRNNLMATVAQFDDIAEDLNRMTQVQLAGKAIDDYFRTVADVDTSEVADEDAFINRAESNKLKAVEVMHELHLNGLGAAPATRGTLWGAYNAAVEFADWRMGARSKDRARYQLFGAGGEFKDRAFKTAVELAAA